MGDLKEAMKQKDAEKLSTVRMIMAAIKNTEIDQGGVLTDEQIQETIAKQVKQLQDAMKDFSAGGRTDLVEQTQKEVAYLSSFLPAQLSDEELETIAKEVLKTLGTTSKQDFGKIMGAVMAAVKGQADGNRVREVVNRLCM